MEQQKEKCMIFGCMGLGGGWNADPVTGDDEKKAAAAIHAAMEIGISTFDHADIYTFGKAEEVFGRVMKNDPGLRGKIILQSKTGIHLHQGPNNANTYNFSKKYILQQVGLMLKRLQTEYLDTLLLHRPDSLMNAAEVAETFHELKTQGLVRRFGVSNMSIHQIQLLQKYWTEPLAANQLQLSLGHSLALDIGVSVNTRLIPYDSGMQGMLEYCQLHDMTIQAYGPLDRGLYTDGHRDSHTEQQRNTARVVAETAERHGVTTSAIVLAWLLMIPGTVQPVIGTTNVDRIHACRDALAVRLTREEWYSLWITARGAHLP
jgi:predicted oxidoreductase